MKDRRWSKKRKDEFAKHIHDLWNQNIYANNPKHISAKQKEIISATHLGIKETVETKDKISNGIKEFFKIHPEAKITKSDKAKIRWGNKQFRKKMNKIFNDENWKEQRRVEGIKNMEDPIIGTKSREQFSKFWNISSNKEKILKNLLNRKKTSNTNIEVIVYKQLKKYNIEFEKQKNIDNIAVVDFFIKPNLCVITDGCFWHGCPVHFKNDGSRRALYIVEEEIPRNKRNDVFLSKEGFKLIHIWEHDIKKSNFDIRNYLGN